MSASGSISPATGKSFFRTEFSKTISTDGPKCWVQEVLFCCSHVRHLQNRSQEESCWKALTLKNHHWSDAGFTCFGRHPLTCSHVVSNMLAGVIMFAFYTPNLSNNTQLEITELFCWKAEENIPSVLCLNRWWNDG